MRTLADVERIKAEEAARRGESAISGYPPGYIFGLDLSIRNDKLYVLPGVASIRGKAVTVVNEVQLASGFWVSGRLPSKAYYVYLDQNGTFTVERVVPELSSGQYYKKSSATGSRYIGSVKTDENGKLSIVISRDPIMIGGGATFEEGYDPSKKVDSVGGKYSTTDGNRSKLQIFPDSENAILVRKWNELSETYQDVFRIRVDGGGEGDVVIGRFESGGPGIIWDESQELLRVRGSIYQENGNPYPTSEETSRFLYSEDVPNGPYKVGDFWVHDDAIFIATVARNEGETGLETDWIWYIRPNIVTSITSTNGDKFKPGLSTTTTLIPRVFRNGVEITSSLPDSAFKWTRKSFYPQTAPNDDSTWNYNHTAGYRTVEVTTDSINARATYTLEIIE